MNDHLIKNFRIDFLFKLVGNLLLVSLLIFIFSKIKPVEWYIWIMYIIHPTYLMFKEEKIILEIVINDHDVTIKDYSILKGKRVITIGLKEIIEIDFFRFFSIKYRDTIDQKRKKFKINAEPWNNLYAQIKALKLAHQDDQKLKI